MARANLKARDYQIDLASKLNKSQVGMGPAAHWHRRLGSCLLCLQVGAPAGLLCCKPHPLL